MSEMPLRVFSFEYDETKPGLRKFLVATYDEFYRRYTLMPDGERHYYEIIQEGEPCHLYFDVEYNKVLNPQLNSDRMMDTFKQFICSHVKTVYGLDVTMTGILDLHSSNVVKFSRHLIVRIKNALFKNNEEMGRIYAYYLMQGRFVNGMQRELERIASQEVSVDECASIEDIKSLFILDVEGRRVLFIDLGVYTRNRQFRLVDSCKIGKDSFLTPSSQNRYPNACMGNTTNGSVKMTSKAFFFATLVGNVDINLSTRMLDGGLHSDRVPTAFEARYQPKSAVNDSAGIFCSSSFVEIQQWLVSHIAQFGGSPSIKSVKHYESLCGIEGSRYCFNVARHHKSNGVYWIIDLYVDARCFDPECRHYSCPEVEVFGNSNKQSPQLLLESLDESMISSEIFDLMDQCGKE